MDKLQKQLNAIDKDDVEVVFFIDSEGNTVEEMKDWLLSQTVSERYVFITKDSVIEDNFLLLRYNAVKNGWSAEKLIELGIYYKN